MESGRLVTYGPEVARDLIEIHESTSARWGYAQAKSYVDFLISEAKKLAENPNLGIAISERPDLKHRLIKWKRSRSGHYLIYQETSSGIHLVRILHSARDQSAGI